jgi:hypothetical protein
LVLILSLGLIGLFRKTKISQVFFIPPKTLESGKIKGLTEKVKTYFAEMLLKP